MSVRNVAASVLCLILSGCIDVPPPMGRGQVIEAIQQCRAADLDPVLYWNIHNRISDVPCHVRKDDTHDRRD